jgi:hypothetical protein
MANLLKPSVDQAVFGNSQIAVPARRRPAQSHNVSFLARDDDRETVAKKLGCVVRVVAAAAVLIATFALSGQI